MLTLVPEEIEAYAAAHSTPPSPLLDELRRVTEQRMPERMTMLSGQVPGLLLQTLVFALGARRVLEVGMFAGYSALMMAEALPDDGELITCDIADDAIALARSYFDRSPHGARVTIRKGPALETMRALDPEFDFVFIDADKGNYIDYYEEALRLLAPRGVIAVDNVLWSGRVLNPKQRDDAAIVAFNSHVRDDERVTKVMLTVRDGITLVRKK
jgi:caffeoyl-CoA O-methyltransferase